MSRMASSRPGTLQEPSSMRPADAGHCCGCSRPVPHSSSILPPLDISTYVHTHAAHLHMRVTGWISHRRYRMRVRRSEMQNFGHKGLQWFSAACTFTKIRLGLVSHF